MSSLCVNSSMAGHCERHGELPCHCERKRSNLAAKDPTRLKDRSFAMGLLRPASRLSQ
jgi:hypothetical protein